MRTDEVPTTELGNAPVDERFATNCPRSSSRPTCSDSPPSRLHVARTSKGLAEQLGDRAARDESVLIGPVQ
jgi:hypothetical protein